MIVRNKPEVPLTAGADVVEEFGVSKGIPVASLMAFIRALRASIVHHRSPKMALNSFRELFPSI